MALVLSTVLLSTAAAAGTGYWIPKWLLDAGDWLYPEVITRCSTREVALTIDDVPYGHTEQLLNVLQRYKIKATLFVISGLVKEADRQLLVRAVKEGHVLGNHGARDVAHVRLSAKDFIKEVDSCDILLNSIYEEAGVRRDCKLFRPGCGLFTPAMLRQLVALDYKLVLGSVYPHDAAIRNTSANSWFVRQKLDCSDIIIVHDRQWTVELLHRVLPWARSRGFVFATLNSSNTAAKM